MKLGYLTFLVMDEIWGCFIESILIFGNSILNKVFPYIVQDTNWYKFRQMNLSNYWDRILYESIIFTPVSTFSTIFLLELVNNFILHFFLQTSSKAISLQNLTVQLLFKNPKQNNQIKTFENSRTQWVWESFFKNLFEVSSNNFHPKSHKRYSQISTWKAYPNHSILELLIFAYKVANPSSI